MHKITKYVQKLYMENYKTFEGNQRISEKMETSCVFVDWKTQSF